LLHSSFSKFALVLNFVLPFWKLLVFESLLVISEISLFNIGSTIKNCPARCASAVLQETDVFKRKNVFLRQIVVLSNLLDNNYTQ
jgi:hypothetical protein